VETNLATGGGIWAAGKRTLLSTTRRPSPWEPFDKTFGEHGVFTGTVTVFDTNSGLYRVHYCDGDKEDVTWEELAENLGMYPVCYA